MAIKHVKVEPHKMIWMCDDCEKGEMELTGISFPTYPERYEHKCNNCGEIGVSDLGYPYIRYEEI